MKIIKDVIDYTIEHKKRIKAIEKMEIEPIQYEEEIVITIPLVEYKELLIYKGKYLGLKDK